MAFKSWFSFLLPFFIFSGCNKIVSTPDAENGMAPYPGMVGITADGIKFTQGSQDPLAGADEQPVMHNSFTYDYWMDSSEVTQGAYQKLMGRNPALDTTPYGVSPDHPVYYVSWFDAVLFCNERSKVAGFDTVYAYCDTQMVGNSVHSMTGLVHRLDVFGYRLPTEAEWEFSARGRTQTPFFWGALSDSQVAENYAWYNRNSGDSTHPVKQRNPNSMGLYDIAGNVLEWTNDWKGAYPETGAANYLGAQEPNSYHERIVKGGSFTHGYRSLRPSNRKEVYPIVAYMRERYIGFRCALGNIPGGVYTIPSGIVRKSSPRALVVDKEWAYGFFGTTNVKFCFVNVTGIRRNLCYVNFGEFNPIIHEIFDTIPVFHPSISPDGRRVAFSTKGEGSEGPSHVYIRNLDPEGTGLVRIPVERAYIPRWWVDPENPDTFLVFTSSARNNGSKSLWGQTFTSSMRIKGNVPVSAPTKIINRGSYHGGLSWDGKHLATGYTRLAVFNQSTGGSADLFQSPANGKDSLGSSQVCNVSVSPETGPPEIMFIDFGYPRTSNLIGSPYGIHEYVFVADFRGEVTKWYGVPKGEAAWDHPEWSNVRRYAIAGAVNASGRHHTIYAMDLRKSSSIRMVAGDDVWHPGLWIGGGSSTTEIIKGTGLNRDSLGIYHEPGGSPSQTILAAKMHDFWQKYNVLEVIACGSSRFYYGINPDVFTGFNAYNMAAPGIGLNGSVHLITDYFLNHCSDLKAIVFDFNFFSLYRKDGNNIWKGNFEAGKGYQYDKSNGFWTLHKPVGFDEIMASIPYNTNLGYNLSGYMPIEANGWSAITAAQCRVDDFDENPYVKKNIQLIDSLGRLLGKRKIHLILVNPPQSPAYLQTECYGVYGPTRERGNQIIAQCKAFEKNPYFHFYDANLGGHHDYTDVDALDQDHLSSAGATKLSKRIDSLLHAVLDKGP